MRCLCPSMEDHNFKPVYVCMCVDKQRTQTNACAHINARIRSHARGPPCGAPSFKFQIISILSLLAETSCPLGNSTRARTLSLCPSSFKTSLPVWLVAKCGRKMWVLHCNLSWDGTLAPSGLLQCSPPNHFLVAPENGRIRCGDSVSGGTHTLGSVGQGGKKAHLAAQF